MNQKRLSMGIDSLVLTRVPAEFLIASFPVMAGSDVKFYKVCFPDTRHWFVAKNVTEKVLVSETHQGSSNWELWAFYYFKTYLSNLDVYNLWACEHILLLQPPIPIHLIFH